jgi:hypothetical protein
VNSKIKYKLIISCSLLVISYSMTSCKYFKKNNNSDIVVAKAYDYLLTTSELTGIIPKSTSPKDSLKIIKDYIDNWFRQKTLLHKAIQNLSKKQMDFSRQIEDYRNSLIIYKFENELIRQSLDTSVTDKEIETYYNNNSNDFELKDNIVKVLYVKTNLKDPINKKIKVLYKSERENDKKELTELCSRHAVNSFLEEDKWLLFNDLLKEIPIETYDQAKYLKNHRLIEFQDSAYSYFVNIKGFRIKEGVAPLTLERDNIRNIIINKRKIKLIKDMEDEAYKQAVKAGEFKKVKI